MSILSFAPRSLKRTVKKSASPVRNNHKKKQDVPTEDLHTQIQLKAYELYEQRGCADGLDVEDWLKAENLIKAHHERSAL